MHCRCVLFLPNSDTTLHGGRTHGQGRSRCWLGKLSHRQRAAFLLEVMHELTIAVRAIFHDHAGDSDLCARSAYDVSELNHRLTSAAISMLANKPTYPALIDMIFGASVDPELSTYLPSAGTCRIEARNQLEAIAEMHWFPQTADALGMLRAMDQGRYTPI